jgi:hypothetical protein
MVLVAIMVVTVVMETKLLQLVAQWSWVVQWFIILESNDQQNQQVFISFAYEQYIFLIPN